MPDKSKPVTYRVGIVGTGGIARAHGRACQELECVELCSICDISEEALIVTAMHLVLPVVISIWMKCWLLKTLTSPLSVPGAHVMLRLAFSLPTHAK